MYVLNNTFVNNGWGGVLGGANMTVHNNIFYNNGRAALKNVSGSSAPSHNLFFGNPTDFDGTTDGGSNVFSDPLFTNTGSPPDFSSFQLGSGSPAIDTGLVVDNYYTEFGVTPPGYAGSAPDIGWFESDFIGSSPTPTSSNPYDLSGDGPVNAADALILLQHWIGEMAAREILMKITKLTA